MRPASPPPCFCRRLRRAVQCALVLGALGCDDRSRAAEPEAGAAASSLPNASTPASTTVPDAAPEHPKTACPDDARGAVRILAPTHCTVPRAVFFGDQDCLLAQPRLSAVSAGARTIGFRQHDVPSRSLYALCGLRPGDVWLRVNGTALDSPEAALALYPSLRAQPILRIDVQRDGTPLQVQLDLED
jgi:hypothetical protein